MGNLSLFKEFLGGRRAVVVSVEERLGALLAKYETYFAELERVRRSELAQLTAHILADRSRLPKDVDAQLDIARAEEETRLEAELRRLRERRAALVTEGEGVRQASAKAEERLRAQNGALDAEEEALKARRASLIVEIEAYNAQIRTLSRGFGFFLNLFRMRALHRERGRLEQDQADLAARIERLRVRWQEVSKEHAAEEEDRRKKWVALQTEAAGLEAKLALLEETRAAVVQQSALERVLSGLPFAARAEKGGGPTCPRCGVANAAGSHFCRICAERLVADRPDLEGSLLEIAELSFHHEHFSQGMRVGQQALALTKGLRSGLEAFTKSVDSMIATENRYPLAKLQLDVPAAAVTYGAELDRLVETLAAVDGQHPRELAQRVGPFVGKVFTEERVKGWFERLGEELSKQAGKQWG